MHTACLWPWQQNIGLDKFPPPTFPIDSNNTFSHGEHCMCEMEDIYL